MILVFLADGFEEIEALTPVDILRRAGFDVKTAAVGKPEGERVVTGSHGIPVTADARAEDFLGADRIPEAVVFPGGMPGAKHLDEDKTADAILARCAADETCVIGAICAAPMILGKRGLLSGRDATCYPGFEKYLDGAKYYEASVVADGNFITADGMGSALDFALQLTALLKSDDESEKIADSIRA